MTESEAGLFDLVPWNYGFVHTGVLAWMLEQPNLRRAVLDAVEPPILPGKDVDLVSKPKREDQSMGATCDLGVKLRSPDGVEFDLAIETKVEDQLRTDQLARYVNADLVVAFLPGLTGFLAAESPSLKGSGTLSGQALSAALESVREDLPPVIGSYVGALAEEARWFEREVEAVQTGGESTDDPPNTSNPKFARDIAWVVGLQRELKGRSECPVAVNHMYGRVVAWDHGFFWGDTREASGDLLSGLGYSVDAAAPKFQESRSIIIKAGFRNGQPDEALSELYDFAVRRGPPADGEWKRGKRQFRRRSSEYETVGCWNIDCADLSIADAADHAISAANWILEAAKAYMRSSTNGS